jgi:hypothetical protein
VDRVNGLESVQVDIVMMRTPDSANHSKSLGQDYLTWKSSHFDEMFRKVSALARLFNPVETS